MKDASRRPSILLTEGQDDLNKLKMSKNTVMDRVSDLLGLHHLKVFSVCLVIIMYFLNAAMSFGTIQLLQALAKENGLSQSEVCLCFSAYGAISILSRPAINGVLDLPSTDPLIISGISLFTVSICTAIFPICTSFPSFIITITVYGIAVSGYYTPVPIVICDLFGVDSLTSIIGFISFARGIACAIGTPLIGMIFQATGSYSLAFGVASFIFLLSLCACIHVFIISRKSRLHLGQAAEQNEKES